jgi:hypothetical protein
MSRATKKIAPSLIMGFLASAASARDFPMFSTA